MAEVDGGGPGLLKGRLWLRLMEHRDCRREEQMHSGKPQESSFHRKAAWRTGVGPRVQRVVGAGCFCQCLRPLLCPAPAVSALKDRSFRIKV